VNPVGCLVFRLRKPALWLARSLCFPTASSDASAVLPEVLDNTQYYLRSGALHLPPSRSPNARSDFFSNLLEVCDLRVILTSRLVTGRGEGTSPAAR